MKLFLIVIIGLTIVSILLLIFFLLTAWSAKKTLLKAQSTWSAKSLKIHRNKNGLNKGSKGPNILEDIALQTNAYLDSKDKSE